MGKDITVEEAEAIISNNRYKELKNILSDIVGALSEKNTDVVSAIDKQSNAIRLFTTMIDKQNIVPSVKTLAFDILKNQSELSTLLREQIAEQKKIREWSFTFSKNSSGEITAATAKQIK